MASIDYIAKLLNTHGVNLTVIGGGTGGDRPDNLAAYGALGLGKLSAPALAVGLAVYAPSERHTAEAADHIVKLIDKYACRHKWDFALPKKQQWSDGELAPDRLKMNLARLAIFEIKQDGKCIACFGTGTKPGTYRVCRKCKGERKLPLAEHFKYAWCGLSRHAWKTWKHRYNRVFSVVLTWKQDFDDHIIRHFE